MPVKRKPGRPRLAWLPTEALRRMPTGTAVALDLGANGTPRVRLADVAAEDVRVKTREGELVVMPMARIRRARVVTGVFESGDAVLRRGVPAAEWRGGVVRCRGREVFVEQMDGSFEWLDEAELERPEAREVDVVDDDPEEENFGALYARAQESPDEPTAQG